MISFDKRFDLHYSVCVNEKHTADHYFMWPFGIPMGMGSIWRERYCMCVVQQFKHWHVSTLAISMKSFAKRSHISRALITSDAFFRWDALFPSGATNHPADPIAICSLENWQVYAFPVITVWFLRLVCFASVWSPNTKHISRIMTFKCVTLRFQICKPLKSNIKFTLDFLTQLIIL